MKYKIQGLKDFCDIEKLYDILDNWSKCTGLSAVILDKNGCVFSKSFGTTSLCSLIQSDSVGKERCYNNWQISKGDELRECHAGFYDFDFPIVLSDGTYLGQVFVGQIVTANQEIDCILHKVKDLNLDSDKVKDVTNQINRKNKKEVEASYNLLKQIIGVFIEKSFTNYRDAEDRKVYVSMFMTGLKTVYRMSIYFNLTNNEYHMIDYNKGVEEVVPLEGCIDMLVEIGTKSIPDKEQAEEYYNHFNRLSLIEAFLSGKKKITYKHQQTFFNGEVHWMEASAVLIDSEKEDDLQAICLTRMIDEDIQNQKLLKESREATKQAINDFKQADYDRRRDFLTGLRNRQDMFDLFNNSLCGKTEPIQSMYMIDIDDFKKMNDKYGHKAGDECLSKIGKALNIYGTQNGMLFYRYGGEEILGVSFDKKRSEKEIAEEIVKLISDLQIKRDDSIFGVVTVSLGYTINNNRYEKMIDKADEAMYKAKEAGKNRCVCFEEMVKNK